MPMIEYVGKNFGVAAMQMIATANQIINAYAAQGFDLTLRQLFYQFVSRDLITNTVQSYKRLGDVVNDARLAGLMDWDRVVDRTRGIETLSHWDCPQNIVAACADQFRYDLWATQKCRVEVWIEKEALAGVFEGVCNELRVPYLSCRGYTSQSEMWRAGRRLRMVCLKEQRPIILHFGDHDPSGMDMSRDIKARLDMFSGRSIEVKRIALNMPQIQQYNPPPNPAKTTDARFAAYQEDYGDESWELDALEPNVLTQMVRDHVNNYRDQEAWDEEVEREQEARRRLREVSNRWDELTENL